MLSLIMNFLNHLESARKNSAASRNIRLAAIKSFMRYMEYRVPSALEQIRCILSIPTKKTDSRLVRHLTAKEMQSILDAPDPARRMGIRRSFLPPGRKTVQHRTRPVEDFTSTVCAFMIASQENRIVNLGVQYPIS